MKNINFIFVSFIVIVILQSCSSVPMNYYQLFEVKSNDVLLQNNELVFENRDVKITYNFWQEYGISTFSVYNKTDFDLQIDLTNSHLIINDFAKTYFRNSNFTESATNAVSSSKVYKNRNIFLLDAVETTSGSQTGTSITYMEERNIVIPSNSYKIVSGFNISDEVVRHCDLLRFPSGKKHITPVNFEMSNSPVNLKNIVSYSILSNPPKDDKIVNSFFVSTVTNYPQYMFSAEVTKVFCGQEYDSIEYIYSAPNKFYIPYKLIEWAKLKH